MATGTHPLPTHPASGLPHRTVPPESRALVCRDVAVRYQGCRKPTVQGVSITASPSALVVVFGRPGSGKSTLCAALAGEIEDVRGQVTLDGTDLLASREAACRTVGFVPADPGQYPELTPRQVLGVAADLRLTAMLPPADRARRVESVLSSTELVAHADTPIARLPAAYRRRVAVATELLNDPPLLVLDEPTADLDEDATDVFMEWLRRLAAAGHVVVMATGSSAQVERADLAVVLDATGQMIYSGPPEQLLSTVGPGRYAAAMAALPRRRHGTGRRRRRRASTEPGPASNALDTLPATRVLLRREVLRQRARPLVLARNLVLFPLVTSLLTAACTDRGLAGSPADPDPLQGFALTVLVMSTVLTAMLLTFSTLVTDHAAIEREHRWGVRPLSAVLAKAAAWIGPAAIQSVVAYTLYARLRPGPVAALPGTPVRAVMVICLALLGITSAMLGLFLGSMSRRREPVTVLLIAVAAALSVLTGLLVPLGHPASIGTYLLAAAAQVTPGRWGAAAIAAYLGFVPADAVATSPVPPDPLWSQDPVRVIVAAMSLVMLAVAYTLGAAHLLTARIARRRGSG